ncbi:kelch-like protein 12 [Ciona intestinalis]
MAMAAAETSFSINGTCSIEEQTHNIDYSSDLLKFANESRQDGCFNDIIIRVGEKNIPANKMVLSCYSKYFNTMFTTEMKENYKDVVEVHGVDAESMEKLVDFMYTGKINFNTNNVATFWQFLIFFKCLVPVRKLCIEYLLTTVSLQNCFTIQALADRFIIPKLTEKFNNFVVENYQEVFSGDQFKKLSKNYVIKLLQSTHDKVSSDLVYTAVMNWVKFDLSSNESYLSQLLKFVDFYKLSPKMLEDVVSVEPLIRKHGDLGYTLFYALVHHSKKTEKSLISLGGAKSLTKVTKFDLQTKQWIQLPDLPIGRDDAAAVVIDDVLYYLAGDLQIDGKITATNIVHRMKLKKKVLIWEKVASMNVKRLRFGAAVLNGTIFVFGGSDDNDRSLSSGEFYVVSLNKWIQLKPMKIARYGHSIVAHNGHLYSLGGYGSGYLCSMERYDPFLDEWKDVAPMQTPRGCFAAVVLNNAIYAIGGYDGKQRLKSVEKYNVDDDTWVYVGNMNIERSRHAACVSQNKIYVVGGLDSNNEVVKSIECYDDQTDKWSVAGETEVELYKHSLVAV